MIWCSLFFAMTTLVSFKMNSSNIWSLFLMLIMVQKWCRSRRETGCQRLSVRMAITFVIIITIPILDSYFGTMTYLWRFLTEIGFEKSNNWLNFLLLQLQLLTDTYAYSPRAGTGLSYCFGEVSEWLKVHAWKACVGESLPWVQIPPSPLKTYTRQKNETYSANLLLNIYFLDLDPR